MLKNVYILNNVTISKIKERTFCKTDREFVEFCISLLKKHRGGVKLGKNKILDF